MSVLKMGERRRGRKKSKAPRPRSRENVFTIRRTARTSAPAAPAKKTPGDEPGAWVIYVDVLIRA